MHGISLILQFFQKPIERFARHAHTASRRGIAGSRRRDIKVADNHVPAGRNKSALGALQLLHLNRFCLLVIHELGVVERLHLLIHKFEIRLAHSHRQILNNKIVIIKRTYRARNTTVQSEDVIYNPIVWLGEFLEHLLFV